MIYEYLTIFATEFRQSINLPTLLLSVYVLYEAIAVVQMWRDDEPKSERFYFAVGIVLHWLATFLGRSIDIMRENQMILVRTAFLMTTLNITFFVFPAGISYIRALTQHRSPNRWKQAALAFIIMIMLTYSIQVFL